MPLVRTTVLVENGRCQPREGGKGLILRTTENLKQRETCLETCKKRIVTALSMGCDGVGQRSYVIWSLKDIMETLGFQQAHLPC